MPPKRCPCQSGRFYERCCEPYLSGEKTAPTAEALMRSRYSAFHEGNLNYLVATHHPTYRQDSERKLLERSLRSSHWLHLQILSTHRGQRKDKQGSVEFVAAYRDEADGNLGSSSDRNLGSSAASAVCQLHERSEFIKENGQWSTTTKSAAS